MQLQLPCTVDSARKVNWLMEYYDPESGYSITVYAERLVGMSFRDVLDLGITPTGVSGEEAGKAYGRRSYKGGMGNLLEERYFGYRANSEDEADFPQAGVELKATCYDRLSGGGISAGERLVLTMIPNDSPVEAELDGSHMWRKCRKILLVYYRRDRSVERYDQRIGYVHLFTPPADDLEVIREDYRTIAALVRSGRAQDLSESLTSYLGACTKGANREKSTQPQRYYAPGVPARRRAWCYKRPYMDYVLHHYVIGAPRAESIGVAGREIADYAERVINAHRGETDASICLSLGIPYTGNKAQWTSIAYRLLGVRDNRADEFEKAGVVVRTVREGPSGRIKENVPLPPFRFRDLMAEGDWEDSSLREYVESTSFLFVVFRIREDGAAELAGCTLWRMPEGDVDGELRRCWEECRQTVARGVMIERVGNRFQNDLPKESGNQVAHVRPHTQRAAYRLPGIVVGDPGRDGDELPDGRVMTRQSFWLNHGYIEGVLQERGL